MSRATTKPDVATEIMLKSSRCPEPVSIQERSLSHETCYPCTSFSTEQVSPVKSVFTMRHFFEKLQGPRDRNTNKCGESAVRREETATGEFNVEEAIMDSCNTEEHLRRSSTDEAASSQSRDDIDDNNGDYTNNYCVITNMDTDVRLAKTDVEEANVDCLSLEENMFNPHKRTILEHAQTSAATSPFGPQNISDLTLHEAVNSPRTGSNDSPETVQASSPKTIKESVSLEASSLSSNMVHTHLKGSEQSQKANFKPLPSLHETKLLSFSTPIAETRSQRSPDTSTADGLGDHSFGSLGTRTLSDSSFDSSMADILLTRSFSLSRTQPRGTSPERRSKLSSRLRSRSSSRPRTTSTASPTLSFVYPVRWRPSGRHRHSQRSGKHSSRTQSKHAPKSSFVRDRTTSTLVEMVDDNLVVYSVPSDVIVNYVIDLDDVSRRWKDWGSESDCSKAGEVDIQKWRASVEKA